MVRSIIESEQNLWSPEKKDDQNQKVIGDSNQIAQRE